jgi:hypothetical protein
MDRPLTGFLTRQLEEGLALAGASDLLELTPWGGWSWSGLPPRRYIARFYCTGLVRRDDGSVEEANDFQVGIFFPGDYLRRAEPFEVLSWHGPMEVHHPNIAYMAPFVCIGHLAPGTPLVEILYRLFEVITYQNVTMSEHDALNKAACEWARRNRARLPVDRRPLKWRVPDTRVEKGA